MHPKFKWPKTFSTELQKWTKSGYKSSFNKLARFPYLYKGHLSSSHLLDLKTDFVLFLKHFYPCCLKIGDLGLNPRRECNKIFQKLSQHKTLQVSLLH